MIKSMTGFGRCEITKEARKITVEMKSVNHRYLDMTIKMSKKLNFFEGSIRNLLKHYIQRGKVDMFISYEDDTKDRVNLKYNEDIAAEYVKYVQVMAEKFGLCNDLSATKLSHYPEVLTMQEQTIDEKALWEILKKAVSKAAVQLVDSRIQEGENLKEDLINKLDDMLQCVERIEERSPQIIKDYRAKLEEKVAELLGGVQVDENRLVTEITLFADKICTDEETVRLKSHINSTKEALAAGGGIGRKLDFIAQEMNREANTILSKANDLTVSTIAIDLKSNIEKIREQIQNIE
ncbi:YicC family protein [Lachnospiraceae bacterium ZAX-1]